MDENFYLDNPDLRFHMESMVDWQSILEMRENFGAEDCPFENADEAREANIDMLGDPLGALAAQRIAPRAEEVDREGCKLVEGEVRFPEGLRRNLEDLNDAQLSGITLGTTYGGLGFSKTFYTAATEIISRADASLMNFFGLQGIGETIEHFAPDDLKDQYLPRMSTGELTGAMVLTEADAGSDLAAVRTRAELPAGEDPETGWWRLKGTKRFITNGCGEVLLVLARSEDPQKYGGGRGLSFFLVEKSERVHVRRIEEKLGIHGSPTCEIYFDDAPARLIGRRGRGLTKYTAWLMAEARLGVAAQSQGISEAALREGLRYAEEREQFGKPIKELPAVASMLADMRTWTEASRTLLYATSCYVDLHEGAEKKELKQDIRRYGRIADILTPMVKYYAAELCNRVAETSLQIHGGNGYMKDYPVERLVRDARITNIYEGTSQIQVDWAILRILRGDMAILLDPLEEGSFADKELSDLADKLRDTRRLLSECTDFVKERGIEYRDLMARRVVDMAVDLYVGWLLLGQAAKWDYKRKVARRFLEDALPRMRMHHEIALSGRPLELDVLEP